LPNERSQLRVQMTKDLIHSIFAFLEKGGPYEYGCSLFFSIASNRLLAGRLMASDSEPNRETLNYELTKYLHSQPNYWERYVSGEFDSSSPADPEPAHIEDKNPVFQFKDWISSPQTNPPKTDIRSKVFFAWKDLYRDRGHLHGRLHQAGTDQDRLEIQKQMIIIQKQIQGFSSDLILIDQGEIPSKYLQSTTTVENFKNRETINRNIRRNLQKLNSTTDPELIKKYQEKIEEYKKQLSQ
jgi:hypothetical protein